MSKIMKTINVEKINKIDSEFIEKREWSKFHSIKNLSMALSVEVSELVEIFQWCEEAESNLVFKDEALKSRVEDEIADIFLYLMRIALKSDINIEEAVLKKIEKNGEKYPIDKARGSSKKYNEL